MFYSLLYIFLIHVSAVLMAQQPLSITTTSSSLVPVNQQDLLNETLNLVNGHQEFKDLYFQQHENDFIRLVQEGQNPQVLCIGCSDSRIVPDLILNTKPGELFVIRTAGNFVPPYNPQALDGVTATIQYAIEFLNIRHIIICGHSHCGAIKGLFEDLNSNQLGILKRWLQLGEKAKQMTLQVTNPSTPKEEIYAVAEEVSVVFQLENLMSYPFVRKRVEEKKIELHGWYFKIETGELWYYHTKQHRFLPLIKRNQVKEID